MYFVRVLRPASRTADANVGAGSRADKSRDRRRRGIREPSIIMKQRRRWGFRREHCGTDQSVKTHV